MEEILSSIKRIIAEDGQAEERPRSPRRTRADRPLVDDQADDDSILELTEPVESVVETREEARAATVDAPVDETPAPVHETAAAHRPAERPGAAAEAISPMLSAESEVAARAALTSLSSLIVKPQGDDHTLEGLVRNMLRPMLKEWLDANLPGIVQDMVAKEIARISGQNG